MKKIILLSLLLGCSMLSFSQVEFANDRIIVKFKADKTIHYQAINQQHTFNIQPIDQLNQAYQLSEIIPIRKAAIEDRNPNLAADRTFVLQFKTAIQVKEVIVLYQETGYFDSVEPDFIGHGDGQQKVLLTPNDPSYNKQWAAFNDGTFSLDNSTLDADMDLKEAWDVTTGKSYIVTAILDTGHKLDHPETNNRIWINSGETTNNNDDDNNSFVDDINGWDFANNDNDPSDDHGHGTNVVGLIGATGNNGIGYAGVDWHGQLMILKVLSSANTGLYSWWTAAIYYAVDNGAHVVNMSLSGASYSSSFEDAVNYAYNNNVVIVASMGNQNTSASRYPAAYTNTIAVGSTDADDTRSQPFFWSDSSGSNYGGHIDVVAPGNFMFGLHYTSNTNYGSYWGGTSQAAPMVAGLVALLKGQDSTQTVDDIRFNFENTSEDGVGDPSEDIIGWDQYYGFGRVNAMEALNFSVANTTQLKNPIKASIFPNPTTTEFTIQLEPTTYHFYQIQLLDARGAILKNILSANLSAGIHHLPVNTTNLSNGFYYITIQSDGHTLTKKLTVFNKN